MQLYFTLAAIHGQTVTIVDTKNAFQQSLPPNEACFLTIDEAIQSWYLKCSGVLLDPRKDMIPVNKALQGHPEAGCLSETMIGSILAEFGFKIRHMSAISIEELSMARWSLCAAKLTTLPLVLSIQLLLPNWSQ